MAAEEAIVLFSGGVDSTTCLARALVRFATVEPYDWGYGRGECPACRLRAAHYPRYRYASAP